MTLNFTFYLLGSCSFKSISLISSAGNQAGELKKLNRKVQGVPQSQTTANPRHKEKGKMTKKLAHTKQTNKCTRSTQTSFLFPKRGDHNSKRNDETRTKRLFRVYAPKNQMHEIKRFIFSFI